MTKSSRESGSGVGIAPIANAASAGSIGSRTVVSGWPRSLRIASSSEGGSGTPAAWRTGADVAHVGHAHPPVLALTRTVRNTEAIFGSPANGLSLRRHAERLDRIA